MSRSNPTERINSPANRFFEWDGENGEIRYYDKQEKKNIVVGSKFSCLLLDELASVRGWHEASESGIYSNEVRDTKQERLVVKAFKGGTLAEGVYASIRDRVIAMGGKYNANLYIAYKHGEILVLGALQLNGAALNQWVEFRKAHGDEVYKKAIRVDGFTEGKKGKVVFRTPKFFIADLSEDTNKKALDLDKVLQDYLKKYFARTTSQKVENPPPVEHDDEPPVEERAKHEPEPAEPEDPEVPF